MTKERREAERQILEHLEAIGEIIRNYDMRSNLSVYMDGEGYISANNFVYDGKKCMKRLRFTKFADGKVMDL